MASIGSGIDQLISSIQHDLKAQESEQERLQKAESRKVMEQQRMEHNWQKFNEQRDDHFQIEENAQAIRDLRSEISLLRQEMQALRQEVTGVVPQGPLNYTPGVL